jgi:hypothetical protein
MRKITMLLMLSLVASTSFARTCPYPGEIFVKNGNSYEVSPPPGWVTVEDKRESKSNNVLFRVAAWGDHKHPVDNVRCFYYVEPMYKGYVEIETAEMMDASHVKAWGGLDPLYYLCSQTTNVNQCPFV